MDIFYPVKILADTVTAWLPKNNYSDVINFFIFDSIKIAILLVAIMMAVHFIKSFFPTYKIRQILASRYRAGGHISAALLGVITPFCSCSAVPLFIGLVESGVPLGITFSYLISAPMVNEVALALLLSLFGWKIAGLYLFSGLIIAVVSGMILGQMKLEPWVEPSVWQNNLDPNNFVEQKKTLSQRLHGAWKSTWKLYKSVFPYILIGVGLGAFIHGYAPEDLLTQLAGKSNYWAVPLAVLVGVPLYSNAAGTIPVIQSLISKGLPLGTALAFMMSITALSLPEMIILKKVMKPKLLILYFGIVTLGIIFTGYLFNMVL